MVQKKLCRRNVQLQDEYTQLIPFYFSPNQEPNSPWNDTTNKIGIQVNKAPTRTFLAFKKEPLISQASPKKKTNITNGEDFVQRERERVISMASYCLVANMYERKLPFQEWMLILIRERDDDDDGRWGLLLQLPNAT